MKLNYTTWDVLTRWAWTMKGYCRLRSAYWYRYAELAEWCERRRDKAKAVYDTLSGWSWVKYWL